MTTCKLYRDAKNFRMRFSALHRPSHLCRLLETSAVIVDIHSTLRIQMIRNFLFRTPYSSRPLFGEPMFECTITLLSSSHDIDIIYVVQRPAKLTFLKKLYSVLFLFYIFKKIGQAASPQPTVTFFSHEAIRYRTTI
jgi:hypothetical protein